MYCFDLRIFSLLLLLAATHCARAEHLIGLGAELDTEEGRAFSAVGSLAIGEETWLTGAAAYSVSRGGLSDLETVYFDGGLDHYFNPVGFRIGLGYWGDSELLDSNDARASLYLRNDKASLSLDYERRAFDLTIRTLSFPQGRSIDFDADGFGLAARLQLSDVVSVYASGMHYDYSQNVSLQPSVDVLRVFTLSRLSIANSLLDNRISGGVEFNIGEQVLDVRAASWRTAVFDDRIDSVGAGLLMPLTASSDIELRLSTDDSNTSGRATLFSVFLYFYGS